MLPFESNSGKQPRGNTQNFPQQNPIALKFQRLKAYAIKCPIWLERA